VIVNFEKVGKPAWPEGLLVGRADIHPEGILVHMVLGPFDVPQYNWRLEETIILLTFRPEVYMPADLRERPRYDTPEGAKWERARRAAQSDAIARSVFPEGCQLLGRVIARFTAEPSKIWKWSW
jgi:hypothetical protein